MTKYIIRPTPGGGSPAFPPAGGINAMAYCHGDGVTDDRAHILAAIANAGANPVYFLAGTYLLSSALTVPDGTDLVGPPISALDYPVGGCQVPTAHLLGPVVHGSNSTFSDLRMGAADVDGLFHTDHATNTTFTRCQFRGGSNTVNEVAPTKMGYGRSCDHITFTDCNWERNLGDSAGDTGSRNNLLFQEGVNTLTQGHMEYIYWDGCCFGSSNFRMDISRNTGCPRNNVEFWNNDYPGDAGIRDGWHHFWITDCVFEGADCCTFNAPSAINQNTGLHTRSYMTITHCAFKGGGIARGIWAYGCTFEGVSDWSMTDCDLYPAYFWSFSNINQHGVDAGNWSVTNCRFHFDDYSQTPLTSRSTEPHAILCGTNCVFTGNTFHVGATPTTSHDLIWLGWYYNAGWLANNVTFTGNHIHDMQTDSANLMTVYNTTNTTITGNTFQTGAGSGPTVAYYGTNTNTTVISGANNTLVHA